MPEEACLSEGYKLPFITDAKGVLEVGSFVTSDSEPLNQPRTMAHQPRPNRLVWCEFNAVRIFDVSSQTSVLLVQASLHSTYCSQALAAVAWSERHVKDNTVIFE